MPTARPEAEPIVAIVGLLLVHEPPPTVFDKSEGVPLHNNKLPVMAAGVETTVTVIDLLQPVGSI